MWWSVEDRYGGYWGGVVVVAFAFRSLVVLLDTVEVVHAQRLAPVDGAAVDGGGVREAIGRVHGDGSHETCERRERLGGGRR